MTVELDKDQNTPVYSPVCTYCKNLIGSGVRRCKAFDEEEGIPLEIWEGRHLHVDSYPGDGGIRFEIHPDVRELPKAIRDKLE